MLQQEKRCSSMLQQDRDKQEKLLHQEVQKMKEIAEESCILNKKQGVKAEKELIDA